MEFDTTHVWITTRKLKPGTREDLPFLFFVYCSSPGYRPCRPPGETKPSHWPPASFL